MTNAPTQTGIQDKGNNQVLESLYLSAKYAKNQMAIQVDAPPGMSKAIVSSELNPHDLMIRAPKAVIAELQACHQLSPTTLLRGARSRRGGIQVLT